MQQLIESLDTTASDFIVKETVNYNNYIIIGVILISSLICYYFFYLIFRKKIIISKIINKLKTSNDKIYINRFYQAIKDLIFDYDKQIYYLTELEIADLLENKKLVNLASFFRNVNNLRYQQEYELETKDLDVDKLKDEIKEINARTFPKTK